MCLGERISLSQVWIERTGFDFPNPVRFTDQSCEMGGL